VDIPDHTTGHAPSGFRRGLARSQREVDRWGPGAWRLSRWSGILPSSFVILALAALLVTPLVVRQRVERLRQEVEEVAEPARALLVEAQFLLARQSAALRGFLITGEPGELDQYARFSARERQIYPELEVHAASLSPELLTAAVELRTLSEQWHRRIAAEELAMAEQPAAAFDALLERELYQRVLDAAGRADLALRSVTEERRREARDIEVVARTIHFLLLLVAGGAAAAVAILNVHIRGLAGEADTRRSQVERALAEADRAVAMRTDLVRGFVHDVKNPLGAADGYADLLASGIRGGLTPAQAETVERIRFSIRGAIGIIDELLDLSRLESGGLQIRREPVNLSPLVREVVRHHSGAGARAGLDVAVRSSTADVLADSDPERIWQILGNLISNALKYTPAPGSVHVGVHAQTAEIPPGEGRWLAITVSDTGPGIPAEELERIFDEFHRVPGSPGRGHGLGLTISRRLARLLGGDVTVRSTLGEGSTFVLWLPVRE
jgi:signal transduction histidine kinase